MEIQEKEKVTKFLDWLIEDIENVEYFNIKDFINKYKDISEHEKSYLPYSIESIARTYELIENTLESNEWFKLTKKGIELKESGKRLKEFENSQKPKWFNQNWIGYLIALLALFFAIYQWSTNQRILIELEKENTILKDSINRLEYDKIINSELILIPHEKDLKINQKNKLTGFLVQHQKYKEFNLYKRDTTLYASEPERELIFKNYSDYRFDVEFTPKSKKDNWFHILAEFDLDSITVKIPGIISMDAK